MVSRARSSSQATSRTTSGNRSHRANPSAVRFAVDALFDAAGDITALPDALKYTVDCVAADKALFLIRPGNYTAAPLLAVPHELDTDRLSLLYEKHYWEKDLWSRAGDAMDLQAGETVVGEQLVDDASLWASELYADFLKPLDMPRLLSGIAEKSFNEIIQLSVFRSDRHGPFHHDQQKLMAALLPGIRVAGRSALQLERVKTETTALADALNKTTEAVFLVGIDGKVLHTNAAADALLNHQTDLTTQDCRLSACRPTETRLLRHMVHNAAIPGGNPRPVVIHNKAYKPAFRVTALPLRSAERARREPRCPGYPVAAVFVVSVRPQRSALGNALAQMYGLTPAETRLTEWLANGYSLKEAARRTGISHETARAQLKAVFQKTDTQRQSELVRLLVCLARLPGDRDSP